MVIRSALLKEVILLGYCSCFFWAPNLTGEHDLRSPRPSVTASSFYLCPNSTRSRNPGLQASVQEQSLNQLNLSAYWKIPALLLLGRVQACSHLHMLTNTANKWGGGVGIDSSYSWSKVSCGLSCGSVSCSKTLLHVEP